MPILATRIIRLLAGQADDSPSRERDAPLPLEQVLPNHTWNKSSAAPAHLVHVEI
jgi:hypothetical protein